MSRTQPARTTEKGNTMNKLTETDTVLITGKTYPVRFGLSKLGGKWNAEAKGYDVPVAREAEALKLVAGRTPGLWPRS